MASETRCLGMSTVQLKSSLAVIKYGSLLPVLGRVARLALVPKVTAMWLVFFMTIETGMRCRTEFLAR